MKDVLLDRYVMEETEIFLNCLTKAALVFNEGIKDYARNRKESFEERREVVSLEEKIADECLKNIKHRLCYLKITSEERKNIYKLLDTADDIVDAAKQVLLQFSIENPVIPPFLKELFIDLSKTTLQAVDEAAKSTRSYLSNEADTADYLAQVSLHEGEVDNIVKKIKIKMFASKEQTSLSHKLHISYFTDKIALLSDKANDVAKKIITYTSG